ncbi:MAG: phosphoribosylformylglycinamidine synthase, purS protein [Candidatus Marinimicrobia bacterium]|nr:phosphoribosylformylglycinamidine synthase, purS protein [Candidatus Neomarinimicrobiota bacterium]|tara:strand:+ start:4194 stop:4445 length:252 start_codon:yes stop_codon:yes gene_type:complete
MKAKIYINYKEGILDPQGKTVGGALSSMGLDGVEDVSIGKYIQINFDKKLTKEKVIDLTEKSCKNLLVNPNTEQFFYEIAENE